MCYKVSNNLVVFSVIIIRLIVLVCFICLAMFGLILSIFSKFFWVGLMIMLDCWCGDWLNFKVCFCIDCDGCWIGINSFFVFGM